MDDLNLLKNVVATQKSVLENSCKVRGLIRLLEDKGVIVDAELCRYYEEELATIVDAIDKLDEIFKNVDRLQAISNTVRGEF